MSRKEEKINTKCPYCDSDEAYLYRLTFEAAMHCPHCNANWIETKNGLIWKIPI